MGIPDLDIHISWIIWNMWPFVSSFFYLACFKDHPHHSMHVSVLHAFLWLNNSIIVCCMYTCVRVCVCVYIYIYICHNLFIHSSAVERLGYLYILAVVNNTAVNWYTRICLQTPLAAQWIRICPPMQGTQFQSLVLEDCTGHEAAKPRHHRHWVCALEPARARIKGPPPTVTKTQLSQSK